MKTEYIGVRLTPEQKDIVAAAILDQVREQNFTEIIFVFGAEGGVC
jgi:hypothetical protein